MRCPLRRSPSPPQGDTRELAEWSPHGHLPSTASTTHGMIPSSCRDASIRCRRSGLRTRLIRKIWGGRGEPQEWGMSSWGTHSLPSYCRMGTGAQALPWMDAIREMVTTRGMDRGTRWAPLGTYFIKAHFCEWPGQERNVPGALHGRTIHCGERRHTSVEPRFPWLGAGADSPVRTWRPPGPLHPWILTHGLQSEMHEVGTIILQCLVGLHRNIDVTKVVLVAHMDLRTCQVRQVSSTAPPSPCNPQNPHPPHQPPGRSRQRR